jgi:hypothetical protein
MKKVYHIYRIIPFPLPDGPDPFLMAVERHGVRDYQSYEEAEGVVIGNELENATILAIYVKA